jgi:SARP family transcriptional regulator, regulator of embCAB operon
MAAVEVDLLGPLELTVGGTPVPVSGPRQRAVLAILGLHAHRVVSIGSIVDAVWDDPAPNGAEHTLQQHVSALRKALRTAGADDLALVTRSPGYELHTSATDVERFEAAAGTGFDAAGRREWSPALEGFESALACWRGPALVDVRDTDRLAAAAIRLDEQRLAVSEARFEALLESGGSAEVVRELGALVEEHPLRERLRGQLMVALYRSGRQADALDVYQVGRRVLVEELGIEPGNDLRELEQAILEQRPDLDAAKRDSLREIHATFRSDGAARADRIVLPDGQVVALLEGVTVLGRDPEASVRLVDSRVSRRHAQITLGDDAVLVDLGSTNGTAVNGTSIAEHLLVDGDVVSLGGVELRFQGRS